jgi:Protein of unknown function (DUF4256)
MPMKAPDCDTLMQALKSRFEKHMHRHSGIAWSEVQARIEGNADALKSLQQMESTGGEPDVIGKDKKSGQFVFVDCSPESPSGRRSTCYDAEARKTRKENAPKASALEMAAAMGVELLTEQQYRELQQVGKFDLKTSSWIATPPDVRALGGALFCDRRYGKVFVYQRVAAGLKRGVRNEGRDRHSDVPATGPASAANRKGKGASTRRRWLAYAPEFTVRCRRIQTTRARAL